MSQTQTLPDNLVLTCPLTIQAADGGDKQMPSFHMIAYTGGPMRIEGFPHPVVVDLEGLSIDRQDIPVRLDHNPRQGVGHTQRVAIENGQVIAEGLISRNTSWARDGDAPGGDLYNLSNPKSRQEFQLRPPAEGPIKRKISPKIATADSLAQPAVTAFETTIFPAGWTVIYLLLSF